MSIVSQQNWGKNKQNGSQIGQRLKRHVNRVVGSHRMRSQTEIRIHQEDRRKTEARRTARRCPHQHRHSGTWKSRSTGMEPWPRSFLQPWWENWRGERLVSRQLAGHILSSVCEVWRLTIGSITWKWIYCEHETRNNIINWREHWSEDMISDTSSAFNWVISSYLSEPQLFHL